VVVNPTLSPIAILLRYASDAGSTKLEVTPGGGFDAGTKDGVGVAISDSELPFVVSATLSLMKRAVSMENGDIKNCVVFQRDLGTQLWIIISLMSTMRRALVLVCTNCEHRGAQKLP
jgi:hypothetical protein